MKKRFRIFYILFSVFFICACHLKSNNNNELSSNSISAISSSEVNESIDYSLYIRFLKSANENGHLMYLYCWEIGEQEWRCGVCPHAINKLITITEIAYMQDYLPCELTVMRDILDTYLTTERRFNIQIMIQPYPIFSYRDKDIPCQYDNCTSENMEFLINFFGVKGYLFNK